LKHDLCVAVCARWGGSGPSVARLVCGTAMPADQECEYEDGYDDRDANDGTCDSADV
jgi:hypothetical protein